MTINELMKVLEQYYGDYENKYLKGFVKSYLIKDYKSDKYPDIKKSIFYYHKAAFKAPCIASIEECINLARAEKDLNKNKGVTTKPRWNYKEQAKTNSEFDKVNEKLTDLFQQTIKKVYQGNRISGRERR